MVYNYSELANKAKHWAQQAVANHWLDASQAEGILEIDHRSPHSLFLHQDTRPLIVAFMGGTGVGKSSLLNRLAGQAIAKVGIVRPTSREVTLYHHQSVTIEQLPENLPLQKIKTSQHDNAEKKNIIWIDMPDFDSTEQSNKGLVLQWLPHIDVLIYVVSPERYRDSKAWQILLSEGAQHGWLFVLNQWDKGHQAQYDDFKQQLAKAGFEEPLIFRTICTDTGTDEFNDLLVTLESLATEHNIQQLELRNVQVRITQLKHALQECARSLDHLNQYQALFKHWQLHWPEQEKLLTQGFAWPLQQFANRYARSNTDVMVKPQPLLLWDGWAESRFNDVLNELISTADHLEIPSLPLRTQLMKLRKKVAKHLHNQTELECRLALTQPGNALQRGFLKVIAVCEILFPLTALSFVAYQVFEGYYESFKMTKAYLGVDFVAHSCLMVAISWLLPAFILEKMQPSLEKAALQGLQKGLNSAMAAIDNEVQEIIAEQQKQQQELLAELNGYIAECESSPNSAEIPENSTLARMLVD